MVNSDNHHLFTTLDLLDPIPETPNGLKNGYYFNPNDDQVTDGGAKPAAVYTVGRQRYYGTRDVKNVTVDSVQQLPLDIFEFYSDHPSNVVSTTNDQGDLSNQMISDAYRSLSDHYYQKPVDRHMLPSFDYLNHHHQTFSDVKYSFPHNGHNAIYYGPRYVYELPVIPISAGNRNGTDGQGNVPVNGDRVVGNLNLPVYDGAGVQRYMGNLKLQFNDPYEKHGQSASDQHSQPIYVGDRYKLPLNSSWMNNYVVQRFFNNDDHYHMMASDYHDFTSDENPKTLYVQFNNVATLIPRDHGAQAQRDNHLDMWIGFSPDQMHDVATVKGRVAFQPDRKLADDQRDYDIDAVEWHTNADLPGRVPAVSGSLVNTNGHDPLSLHYQMQNEDRVANLFYVSRDGDLLNANDEIKHTSDTTAAPGGVVTWTQNGVGHLAGQAVSGNDLNQNMSLLEPYAYQASNSGSEDDVVNFAAPQALQNEGFRSNLPVDYSARGWRDYQKDPNGNALIVTTGVSSVDHVDNQTKFTVADSVASDLPTNHANVPVNFTLPDNDNHTNSVTQNPVNIGDSFFLDPDADQIAQKNPQPHTHWITLHAGDQPGDVKFGWIPTANYETEHGTFDANGRFVPDDYEAQNEPTNLKWAHSVVKIHFMEAHNGHFVDSGTVLTYLPSINSDSYVGADHLYTEKEFQSDLNKPALQALKNAGYVELASNLNGIPEISGQQYFVLPNGTKDVAVYVAKAGTGSNDPHSLDHYVPIGPANPNFMKPGQPNNRYPFLPSDHPVKYDSPDAPGQSGPNRNNNLIPSPNYAHQNPQSATDHNGMVPGPNGWVPHQDVPAIQADFTIHANVVRNDGGGVIDASDVPVAIDITANRNALNQTYTLSTRTIRQAIVNHALANGYLDADGQAQDLYYDSIMREPNSAYTPIKYKIIDLNGSYHVALVGNNVNAGNFMFTPSNAIINYEGAVYRRDAGGEMRIVADGKKRVESTVVEGYQGMMVNAEANHDVQKFMTATGWTTNTVTGEVIKPFTLTGYDANFMDHHVTSSDKGYNPNHEGSDYHSGLNRRMMQYGKFYNVDYPDLREQKYLPDERALAYDNGGQLLSVDPQTGDLTDENDSASAPSLSMTRLTRLLDSELKLKADRQFVRVPVRKLNRHL